MTPFVQSESKTLVPISVVLFLLVFATSILHTISIRAQTCEISDAHYHGAVQMRKMRKSEEAGALIPGCIRELGETEMYVGPKLTDSLGHEQRMFGREALSYYFIKNEDTIFYLNSGRALRTYRWIFLERRVSGSMELYSFTTHGTSIPTFSRTSYTYYYFRMDGNWLNKKAIVWNETGKRKQLNQIFSKCTPALELIEATPSLMLDEILIQLVNLYNKSCQ